MRLQIVAVCVVVAVASAFGVAQSAYPTSQPSARRENRATTRPTTRPAKRPTTRPFNAPEVKLSDYGLAPQPGRLAPVPSDELNFYAQFPVQQTPQGWVILTNGQPSRPYRDIDIMPGKFGANADMTQYALIVRDEEGKEHVYANGQEGPAHDKIRRVAMSPDGKRVAYVATTSERGLTLFLDGKPQGRFHDVADIVFGPGDAVAWFGADEQPTEAGKGFDVFVNGKRYDSKFRWVYGGRGGEKREFHFSPDGKRWAVLGQVHATNRNEDGGIGGYAVMIDGKMGPVHKDIVPQSLQFSADGAHVFYAAGTPRKGDYAIHKDFQPGASRWNFINNLKVSQDGARYAFIGFDGAQEGRWRAVTHAHDAMDWSPGSPNLVVDDQIYERSVVQFGISENLNHILHVSMRMENNFNAPIQNHLVFDKKPVSDLGEGAQFASMRVSPSGKHWAMISVPASGSRQLFIEDDRHFDMPSGFIPLDAIPREDGKYDLVILANRKNSYYLFDPATVLPAHSR